MTSTVVIDIPVQGPRGPKGDQGEAGPIGLRGIAGPIGQLGLQGEPGLAGAGYRAASTTSATISNSATVTLTTQSNLAYTQGARVRVSSTGSGALMEGTVSSYESLSGILITVMDLSVGAGTHTDWTINIAGNPGTIEGATLGTLSTQNKNAVDITGGTITGMPTPTSPSDVATKTYVDSSTGAGVPTTRLVSAGGLLTGGGSLAADRTITATGATQVEAETGTDNTHVMTPLRTNQAIAQLQLFKAAASQAEAQAGVENSKGMTALRVAQAIASLGVGFPAGTVMLFQQTAAPTSWTKLTTHNDKTLRVVSGAAGSGGVNAFSATFAQTATAGHALVTAENGPHQHDILYTASSGGDCSFSQPPANGFGQWVGPIADAGHYFAASSAQLHHSNIVQSSGSGTAHTHNMDIRVQYVDVIFASKD